MMFLLDFALFGFQVEFRGLIDYAKFVGSYWLTQSVPPIYSMSF